MARFFLAADAFDRKLVEDVFPDNWKNRHRNKHLKAGSRLDALTSGAVKLGIERPA